MLSGLFPFGLAHSRKIVHVILHYHYIITIIRLIIKPLIYFMYRYIDINLNSFCGLLN